MNNNAMVSLVGRVLIALLFLVAGYMKATGIAGTTGYFAKLGMPAPELMAYLAIAIELGGGLLLLIGWQTRKVAWFLALFVLVATGLGHRFWEFDGGARVGQLNAFLKNVAIIGGLMLLANWGPGRLAADTR